MSKVIIYDLAAGLPTYLIDGEKSEFIREISDLEVGSFDTDIAEKQEEAQHKELHQEVGDDEDLIPDWVKIAAEIGWFGEKLTFEYLSVQSFDRIEHVAGNARYGYDIEVIHGEIKHAYEVKTTTQSNNKFHITYNELHVANKLQDNYHIMFVKIDDETETINGYCIDNPIKTFDIDFAAITKLLKTQAIELTANQFTVNINENFLGEIKPVSFNDYIEKVIVGSVSK